MNYVDHAIANEKTDNVITLFTVKINRQLLKTTFKNYMPSTFSTFTRCVSTSNASAALIYGNKKRGYPKNG